MILILYFFNSFNKLYYLSRKHLLDFNVPPTSTRNKQNVDILG